MGKTLRDAFYKLEFTKKVTHLFFCKLCNWLSAEFDLFLQEDFIGNKLIIYVPDGKIILKYNYKISIFILVICNKNSIKCLELKNKVLEVYKTCYKTA